MEASGEGQFFLVKGEGTRVLILGGGRAALIKASSLIKRKFTVHCIADRYGDEIKKLAINSDGRLILKTESFNDEVIDNYHIVVIATDSAEFNNHVQQVCTLKNKLFIETTMPEVSQGIMCTTAETESVVYGLMTKGKNPMASVYLSNKAKKALETMDPFIKFITEIRNYIADKELRKRVSTFICSDDYRYFYQKGKGVEILIMFYPQLKDYLLKEGSWLP